MSLPAAIPSDGVILKSVTDEFNTGDSVMRVLKSTLKANGISYQITSRICKKYKRSCRI